MIITTYDSLIKLKEFINEDSLIIADEIHEPTQAYNYKKKEYFAPAYDMILQATNSILISATPDSLLQKLNYHAIEVQCNKSIVHNIHRIDYKGSVINAVVSEVMKYTGKGKIIIRLNSKSKTETAINKLIESGCNRSLHYLNADNKEDNIIYNSIVENELIPNNVDILFITSLSDSGVTINNTDIGKIIIADTNNDKITTKIFLQFAARFRKMQQTEVYILKLQTDSNSFDLNINNEFKKLESENKHKVKELNEELIKKSKTVHSIKINKRSHYNDSQAFTLKPYKLNMMYAVNYLALLHEVYKDDNLNRSIEQFYTELKREKNIMIADSEAISFEKEPINKEDRQIKINQNRQLLELIEQYGEAIFEIIFHYTLNKNLRNYIKEIQGKPGQLIGDLEILGIKHADLFTSKNIDHTVYWYLNLKSKGLIGSFIVEFLKYCDSSLITYNLFIKGLSILHGIMKPESLNRQEKQDIDLLLKVRADLWTNYNTQLISSKEWMNILQATFKKYKIKRHEKNLDLLNILFDVEKKRTKKLKLTNIIGINELNNFVKNATNGLNFEVPEIKIYGFSSLQFFHPYFEIELAEYWFENYAA